MTTPADAIAELAGLAGYSSRPATTDALAIGALALAAHGAADMAIGRGANPELYLFDRLLELADLAGGGRRCTVCGCTDVRACPGGCSWATKDPLVCTSCVGGGDRQGGVTP